MQSRPFTRQYERKPIPAPVALLRPVNAPRVGERVAASPKKPRAENRALLDLAAGKPCLVQVRGVCKQRTETTIAAHSNKAAHGKGKSIKAHDYYSVWCCFECHIWLDQGPMPAHVKDVVFMNAHLRQVNAWRLLAVAGHKKEADAAQWALDRLNASPTGHI